MLVAFVMSEENPQKNLERLLINKENNEFHACERMLNNQEAQSLRENLRDFINFYCKWGVIVFPDTDRWKITRELARVLVFISTKYSKPTHAFLDESLIKRQDMVELKNNSKALQVEICKSHEVYGIQLADLVAASCGVRLREELSGLPKLLKYGKESGYEPPIEAPLGFELWASLRWSMYSSNLPSSEASPELCEFITEGYGFFTSENCTPELRSAAYDLFGTKYLGCIH